MKKNAKDFISLANSHIFTNVGDQVEREIQGETSVSYDLAFAAIDTISEEGECSDVMEWWTVSSDFAYFAKNAHEVIVETPFGIVWGRQTTGQPVNQDLNVQKILENFR